MLISIFRLIIISGLFTLSSCDYGQPNPDLEGVVEGYNAALQQQENHNAQILPLVSISF